MVSRVEMLHRLTTLTTLIMLFLALGAASTVSAQECRSLPSQDTVRAAGTTIVASVAEDHDRQAEDCCQHAGPCRQCHVGGAHFAVVSAETSLVPDLSSQNVTSFPAFALSEIAASLLRPPRA